MKGFILLLWDSFDMSAHPAADVFILNSPDDGPLSKFRDDRRK
jgi:hypothetical protein